VGARDHAGIHWFEATTSALVGHCNRTAFMRLTASTVGWAAWRWMPLGTWRSATRCRVTQSLLDPLCRSPGWRPPDYHPRLKRAHRREWIPRLTRLDAGVTIA
jgi:hypothetical protein